MASAPPSVSFKYVPLFPVHTSVEMTNVVSAYFKDVHRLTRVNGSMFQSEDGDFFRVVVLKIQKWDGGGVYKQKVEPKKRVRFVCKKPKPEAEKMIKIDERWNIERALRIKWKGVSIVSGDDTEDLKKDVYAMQQQAFERAFPDFQFRMP